MKAVKLLNKFGLILIGGLIFSVGAAAQEIGATPTPVQIAQKEVPKDSTKEVKIGKVTEPTADAPKTGVQTTEVKTDDKTLTPEEAAVIAYYNNYLTDYRLGPNDVIAVEVFGQCPDYCKESITVPPTARISYPLIREGILVGGKTVEQVADEITKKLDEYIIEPKVTVTLDKAMSVRYSVLGKVAAPGVRVMDRKVSLYEAVVEAGGVTKEGDKKRVTLYRFDAQGRLKPQIVDLQAIERGREDIVLQIPGHRQHAEA